MDWNLLPLYTSLPRDAAPLWNVIDMQSQQYCEFEVKNRVDVAKEDERNENADIHTCHICEVNVPKVYIQDHILSEKHITYSAIVDRALERMRRQMALTAYTTARPGRTFFCAHCSISVAAINKAAHETSEHHKLTVLQDRMVKHLKSALENKNNAPKVLDEILELKRNTDKELYENRSVNNANFNMENAFVEAKESGNKERQIKDDEIIDNKSEKDQNSEPSDSDLESFWKIVASLNKQSLKLPVKDLIQVRTPSGDTLSFAVADYHKYKTYAQEKFGIVTSHMQGTTEKDEVKCTICSATVPNEKIVIEEHLNTEEHKTKYFRKLESNSMTKLNDMVTLCTACSDYIIEFDELQHINTKKHKKNVNVLGNIAPSDHNSKTDPEMAIQSDENNKTETKDTVTGSDHFVNNDYIVEYNRNFLFCKVCRIFVMKSNLILHTNKSDHKINLSKYVNQNGSQGDMCALDKKLTKQNAKIMNLPSEIERTSNDFEVKCKICNIIVPCTVDNINGHLLGARHSKAVDAKIEEEKSKKNIQDKKVIEDGNVGVSGGNKQSAPATLSYAEMAGLNNNKVTKDAAGSSKTAKNIQKPTDTVNKAKLPNLFRITDDPNKVKCKVCNAEFGLAEAVIPAVLDKHRISDVHKNAYNAVLASETMCRIKQKCYCLCCDEVLKFINLEYHHMHSSQHKLNLTNCIERVDRIDLNRVATLKISDYLTNIDKKNVTLSKDNILTPTVTQAISKESNSSDGFCKICNVEIPRGLNSTQIHMKGERHRKNVEKKLNIQQCQVNPNLATGASASIPITKPVAKIPIGKDIKKNVFFCNICDKQLDLSTTNETEHMNSKKHKRRARTLSTKEDVDLDKTDQCKAADTVSLVNTNPEISTESETINVKLQTKSKSTQDTASYFCNICKTSVPNSNIEEHNIGRRHKSCLENIFGTKPKQQDGETVDSAPNDVDNKKSAQHDKKVFETLPSTSNSQTVQVANDIISSDITVVSTKSSVIDIKNQTESKQDTVNDSTKDDKDSTNDTPSNILSENDLANKIETQNENTNTIATEVDDNNIIVPTDGDKQDNKEPQNCETNGNSDKENDGFYICKICRLEIPNDPVEIKSHIVSYRHIGNIESLEEKENALYPNINEKIRCDICEVDIDKRSIESVEVKNHDKTAAHDKNLKLKLAKNCITMRENRVCYCKPCDLYFNKHTVATHIATKQHVASLFKYNTKVSNYISKIDVN